jgi:hypothetical protein
MGLKIVGGVTVRQGMTILVTGGNVPSEPTYYTTALYPILTEDSLEVGTLTSQKSTLWGINIENMDVGFDAVSATLPVVINYINYTDGLPENMNIGFDAVSATLPVVINYINYTDGLPENMDVGFDAVSANMVVVINYINYDNYPTEQLNVGFDAVSASLI